MKDSRHSSYYVIVVYRKLCMLIKQLLPAKIIIETKKMVSIMCMQSRCIYNACTVLLWFYGCSNEIAHPIWETYTSLWVVAKFIGKFGTVLFKILFIWEFFTKTVMQHMVIVSNLGRYKRTTSTGPETVFLNFSLQINLGKCYGGHNGCNRHV